MLWERKVKRVVALNQFGKEDAPQYWSSGGGGSAMGQSGTKSKPIKTDFSNSIFEVSSVKSKDGKRWRETTIEIVPTKSSNFLGDPHRVKILEFNGWPDSKDPLIDSVPEKKDFFHFVEEVVKMTHEKTQLREEQENSEKE